MPKKEDFFLPDSVDILGFEVVGRKLGPLKSGPQLHTVMRNCKNKILLKTKIRIICFVKL